jgi:hypothetical protein
MRIIPTLRPTRPKLIVFSIPTCDWVGLMFVPLNNAKMQCILAEAEHYNAALFIPQYLKA